MGSSGSAKRPRDARRTTLSASGAANPILGLYLFANECLSAADLFGSRPGSSISSSRTVRL